MYLRIYPQVACVFGLRYNSAPTAMKMIASHAKGFLYTRNCVYNWEHLFNISLLKTRLRRETRRQWQFARKISDKLIYFTSFFNIVKRFEHEASNWNFIAWGHRFFADLTRKEINLSFLTPSFYGVVKWIQFRCDLFETQVLQGGHILTYNCR